MSKPQISLTSRALKGIGWSGVSQFARLGIHIGIGAILARLLSPEDFGLVGMVAIFSGVVGMFSELGLGAAVIQRKDITQEHLSSVFLLNIAVGLFLTIVMFGLAPGIARFYREKKLVPITMALGTQLFISSFAIVQHTLFTKRLEFNKLAVVEIIATALAGALAAFLAFSGVGVWSLVIHSIASVIITAVLLWFWSKWRPHLVFYWNRVKELFKFGFNLLGFNFVNYFSRNLDNLLIGKFLGAAALGYYSRAYSLMLLPVGNISGALSRVLFPAFSMIQNDLPKVREKYTQATRYISTITFPMMLGLLVVAPELIRVLYGSKWVRSILLFQILCLVGMVQSIVSTLGWIYLSQGRTDIFLKWAIFATTVVGSSFLIGLRWDVEGVAIAYATATLLLIFPTFYIPFRLIKLRITVFFRNFILTATASFAMAAIVFICRYYLKYMLGTNDIVTLLLCSALGVISYLCLMGIWGRGLLREICNLTSQVRG